MHRDEKQEDDEGDGGGDEAEGFSRALESLFGGAEGFYSFERLCHRQSSPLVCHPEVLRRIWPARAIKPDPSE
jgi:hypothetical protein